MIAGLISGPSMSFWTQEKLDAFSRLSTEISFPAGSCLFLAGDPPDCLFLLEKGTVTVSRYMEKGNGITLYTHFPRVLVGLDGIFAGERREGTALAVTDVVCHKMLKQDFINLFYSDIELAAYIAGELSRRLRHAKNKFINSNSMEAKDRIIFSLLQQLVDENAEDSLTLSITQQGLANILAVSRQTISTQLQYLQEKGVLELTRGRIFIRDPDKLRGELKRLIG